MKITCDKCSAVYRIPEEKLTKDVSRATCKKCGAKLIIRRPGAGEDGYDDFRMSGGQGGLDEDAVINHEERTVIAQVPELQKFDATSPLSSGGMAPQDDLRGLLGGNPSAGSGALNTSRSLLEDARGLASAPFRPPPSVASRPVPTPSVPSANITASTSPAPPSGVTSMTGGGPGGAGNPSAMGTTAPMGGPNKASVVDIFSRPTSSQGGPSGAEFQQPTSRFPLVLLGVALLGVLAFIDHGLWGLTKLTAVGFFVALYCIIAAFLTQLDLSISGRINFVKVFLLPAIICVALLAILWTMQARQIAFLHPNLSVDLIKEFIVSLPEAPEAERRDDSDIADRIDKAISSGTLKPRPTRASEAIAAIDPSQMTRPDLTGTSPDAVPAPDGGPGGLVTDPMAPMGTTPRRSPTLPGGPSGPVASLSTRVEFDSDGIERAIRDGRVDRCFQTDGAGIALPGRVDLRIQMAPEGSARTAQLDDASLRNSSLEKCMKDKVSRITFPTFEASSAQWYTYTFIR